MNHNVLPKDRQILKLREVLSTIETGLRPEGGVAGLQEGIPSIGAEHLNDYGGFDFSKMRYIPYNFYANMRRGRIQINDILLVKNGAATAKVSLVPPIWPFEQSAVNEQLFILRPTEQVLPGYLFFYLYSPLGRQEVKKNFQGSNQKNINQTFSDYVNIPLPPLSVQERIVKILRKADEIRRKRKYVLEVVNKILPALFLEMFGDPVTNPNGYDKTTLDKVTLMVTRGYTPRGGVWHYSQNDPLFLRSQNIQMLSIALPFCTHIPEDVFKKMKRAHVQFGDVLMNITGQSTAGRVTWVSDPNLRAAASHDVCIIRLIKKKFYRHSWP